jgi:hypothetical protein
MGRFDNDMNRIGLKNKSEIEKELRELATHMPILYQGFMLREEFKADISEEYMMAAMALSLARELKATQEALIIARQREAPRQLIF